MMNTSSSSRTSRFLRTLGAFAALALLPAAAQAAVRLSDVNADDCYLLDLGTDTYQSGETMFLYIKTSEPIDQDTVADSICLRFYFSDRKDVHLAQFAFCDEDADTGDHFMVFSYTVQPEDFSRTGVYPGAPTLFTGGTTAQYNAIRTQGGVAVQAFQTTKVADPSVPIESNTLVNPDRDAYISVYFLDEEGNRIPPNSYPTFIWGQKDIPYVIDIGHAPSSDTDVEIDWGTAGVFFEDEITIDTVSAAVTTNTIPYIRDNGAAFNSETLYTISAAKEDEGGTIRTATLTAKVYNTFELSFCHKDGLIEETEVSEGDRGAENKGFVFLVNRGADPPGGPQAVTLNWSVSNVFGTNDSEVVTLTSATGTSSTINKILDNGAAPNGSHTYTVTATIDNSGRKAETTVTVNNVEPEFKFLGPPDALFGTSTNGSYAVGATIESSVTFGDPAGALDEPFTVTWSYGGVIATNTTVTPNGDFWESTSSGQLKNGRTSVAVTIRDKNGGTISTNLFFFTEQGPLLYATVAETHEGLSNLGDGTISILQPGGGTVIWDPVNGTQLPADPNKNDAKLLANPYSAAESDDGYDSFIYKWFCESDRDKDSSADDYALMKGSIPRTGEAIVNLWSDHKTKLIYASPSVEYLFSREKYRPDNFGDIDGDGLGDQWELTYFKESAAKVDSGDDTTVIPSESAAAVYDDANTLLYDFSGTGNMDGDGLPANCWQIISYTVENPITLTGGFEIPADEYSVKTFLYPLDAQTIRKFGYLPLGSTRKADEGEDSDIAAFKENPYVDEDTKGRIAKLIVNFSNELEFRGAGEYQGIFDGVENITFRPVGDGDDPGTRPDVPDSDYDGMPDGWEYYFWAVAYYNIGSDQWLAFDGENPDGYSYKGTGAPIDRDTILAAFNPTSTGVSADTDNDGLTDTEEFLLGTNPINWDTDGDGLPDGWEVDFGVLDDNASVVSTDEEGNTVITIDDTSKIFLNPLDPRDANNNVDGDVFACSDDDVKHFDVFVTFDFDPRTGWHAAGEGAVAMGPVSYADNTFQQVEFPNTRAFTALEEFNVAAWRFAHGYPAPVPDTGSNAYWGNLTTNPGDPDTDHDGMPDGWELYVGGYRDSEEQSELSPNHGSSAYYNGDPVNNRVSVDDPILDFDNDRLDNLHEFLCTMAADDYAYLSSEENDFLAEIEAWPNKPWPTNPRPSLGLGYADGADTDGDQILDSFEKAPNCNPTCVDTDHDWLPDAWECYYGTDPLFRDAFIDYDGDGLSNWQEYLTGAVWAWQYDKWYDLARIEGGFGPKGPGYGEVDMWDFFVSAGDRDTYGSRYGGFGRHPHQWDISFGAQSRIARAPETQTPYYFLLAEPRSGRFSPRLVARDGFNNNGISNFGEDLSETGFNEIILDSTSGSADHVTDSLWTYSQSGYVKHATCDPWNVDTDRDGMDDYYEAFHGLNPLYGGVMLDASYDIVGKSDPSTGDEYPSAPWDLLSYPWLSGDPDADPDKDGLSSREECANFYVNGGTHHTDPSPYWITDPSYERSFVNLYYQPGRVFYNQGLWYFGMESTPVPPRYAFDFEVNEGYDTDNDNVPDRSEATVDELSSKADPLDFDNPRRRKALYFNGVDAAARTRGTYSVNVDEENFDTSDLRNFTVEAWICPVNPAAGRVQTLIERGGTVPQDTAQGDITGKRLNFRLSITEIGELRGEFHNYQGAHVTMETSAGNAGLRAGVWTHVAMTYSGSPSKVGSLTIYVNGRSVGSAPSNHQAFNGILQGATADYGLGTDENGVTWWVQNLDTRVVTCPIVLGASDANPSGDVNGHVEYVNGGVDYPSGEPVLEDFFQGWMDEVRIWNGAASEEAIRSRMFTRMDKAAVAANLASPADKIAGTAVQIRYHYTFDNLPDVLPAADRDPEAFLYPSDVEALPVGFAELYTAPVDGSYPAVRWWDTSVWRAYRYDPRHIPWIENTVAHLGKVPVRDVPRAKTVLNDAGDVNGWTETAWEAQYGETTHSNAQLSASSGLAGANGFEGNGRPASWLPNGTDPYNTVYSTFVYDANYLWNADPSVQYPTNAYVRGEYESNEGSREDESLDWASDLLPLGGAVADIDVELWDGLGEGYLLATVDSDGDGIPDWWETLYGLDPFNAVDAWNDDDRDGLDNMAEYLAGTHPSIADTDADGYSDYFSRDTDKSLTYGELYDDGDNMPSWWESLYSLNPRVNDGADDPDGDGWSNYAEYLAGTDPRQGSSFPVPPVVANVTYNGHWAAGNLVLYGWHDAAMRGRPDAVYYMRLQPKDVGGQAIAGTTTEYDPGTLKIVKEYMATLHEGQRTYSGKLAYGNILNNATFALEVYENESVHRPENDVTAVISSSFYCKHCGVFYSQSQMTELSTGLFRCPQGHGPRCAIHTDDNYCYVEREGRSTELSSGLGAHGSINYDTGEWTITFPDLDDAGWTLIATYETVPESAFPVSLRRKWTSAIPTADPSVIHGGHLREGENRFFAFLDLDNDYLYDAGEPAGMALYQPHDIGVGTVEMTIPLTDQLTGYPRFGWEAVDGVDEYFVSLSLGSSALVTKQSVGARTFFMERDVASMHGVNLAASKAPVITWSVFTNVNDTVAYATGSTPFDVYSTTRKTMSIMEPVEGAVVSDASIVLKWSMDWRNEGVTVTIQNTDNGTTYISQVINHPQRFGSVTGDYHYEIEPQKVFGNNKFIDLPDGHYTATITEFVQNTGVTEQSKSVNFLLDRTGSVNPNSQLNPLGSISGTIRYYGKLPFNVEGEYVGTFNGETTRLTGVLSRTPIPGSVSVYVVNGGTTNFVASDNGAQAGYSVQGLSSSYGAMIQTGSYVTYGDNPAISLELDTPPSAGSELLVGYKHSKCPIRVQAFSTELDDGASFSTAPSAQVTVYTKGAFVLPSLPSGTYYLRAFIDQDHDNFLDNWESVGYAMNVMRQDIGINNFAAFSVPPGASNVDIVIYDRDTDADQLPDSWEYFYFGGIDGQGGFTSKKAGVLLWQEYADGELDSNPLVEDTDRDGLPDVIEHQVGSNNHSWDSDGDGVGDLEEFLAGSSTTDAKDTKRFAAPAPTFLDDGTPALVLTTPYLAKGTYLWYEVLAKDSLSDEDWICVGDNEDNEVGIPKDSVQDGCPAGTVIIEDKYGKGVEAGFYKVKAHFGSDTLLDQ